MKKALIPTIIIFTLLLASCGKSQDVGDVDLVDVASEFYEGDTLDNRIVLTIGGIFIPHDIRLAVSEFNRASGTHRIEFIEYIADDASWEHWAEGFMRLQLEIMAGHGPDIIYDQFGWMANHELVLDLYPFIDADAQINRSDFFEIY